MVFVSLTSHRSQYREIGSLTPFSKKTVMVRLHFEKALAGRCTNPSILLVKRRSVVNGPDCQLAERWSPITSAARTSFAALFCGLRLAAFSHFLRE